MKRKRTKKKAKKRAVGKKRRKISRKHNSGPKTVNLQKAVSFKFSPLMKAYENFWGKRKNEKKKQDKLKTKNR